MKRSAFIKSFATLAGGGIVLSCKNGLISDFLEPETTKSLSVDEAKKWFEGSYLTRFNKLKQNSTSKHERIADWEKAKQTEARGKGKCVVVPVSYATKYKPAFLA